MIKRVALSLLLAALPALAFAQSAVLQGGTQTSGHIPQYANTGSSTAVIMDGGTAAGGAAGVNPAEIGITARGTGTAPYDAQGSGPSGTILCTYDAPTTNANGYHALCFSPNVSDKGRIDYSYGGTATPQGLDVVVNGYTALSLSSTGVLSQALTDGHYLVGNVSNLATDVAMSGDCTLANTGAVTCTTLNSVAPGDLFPLDYDANFTTSGGSLTFANIASGTVLGNATGGAAAPSASTVTSMLDRAFSSTQGSVIYRDSTGWAALGPGVSGELLQSGGPAANPAWAAAPGTGTVTSIATNNGVTGGTITSTGTIGLANINDGQILANTTGGASPPSGSSTPVLGIDATTAGTLGLANGSAGGDTVTIQNPSTTAGAYNFNLPATAGTSGQLLTSAGGGSSPMTWTSVGSGGVQAYDAVLADLAGLTLAQGDILYYNGSALVNLGPGTSGQFLKTQGAGANPVWAAVASITSGTKQDTTSGTAVDFTGIPAGTKQITISFNGVSLSGTDNILIQIGDAGGIETSGYVSASGKSGSAGSGSTAGFIIISGGAAGYIVGSLTLNLLDAASFTWASSHGIATGGNEAISGGGIKSLSAELTQVSITRTGSNTFDAGSANIFYQ